MKAILVDESKNLKWAEVPEPVLKPGEVMVEIGASGVNRADLMQRDGLYPPPPGCPEWMGLEIAGEITTVTPEAVQASCRPGDRVCALMGGGGYAERAAVHHSMLMPVPKGFSLAEAAAVPEAYATAYLNLILEGRLHKGETCLVFAGASGVGIACTHIAKAFDAKVVATVRSDEKAAALEAVGADLIVNTRKTPPTQIFEEHPVNLVIDCVGGPDAGACFARMARYGRWVSIATLGGAETTLDMSTVYKKGLRLIGSTLRSRAPEVKAEILAGLVRDVFPHFEQGRFRPLVHKTFDIRDAEAAHAEMKANRNTGKIILTRGRQA